MGPKKFIKKALRKTKRIVFEKIYVQKRKMTLKKICKISNIELPKELKKYKNKQIKNITLSVNDLKPTALHHFVSVAVWVLQLYLKIYKNKKNI